MKLHNTKILFIGLGNMGGALAEGLLKKGVPAANLAAVDPSPAATEVAQKLGIQVCVPAHLPFTPDVALLAVKPQLMAEVAPVYAPLAGTALFLSIAAGTTTEKLQGLLGANAAIIRAMPNTPAAIGKGMTVLFATTNASPAQKQTAEAVLTTVGQTAWVTDEDLMNAVTAVSGSGPAYFFLLMEALAEAGEAKGLSPSLARQLAVATAEGAGALAARSEHGPARLREMVTSPGGTTAAGLAVFEKRHFKSLLRAVVATATRRAKKLT